MYNKINFCCLLLHLAWTTSIAAQENFSDMKDVASFQSRVEEIMEKTLSIESDFEQEKLLSFLDEKILTKGKFYFRPKNKLRWEYLDPFEYLIILNEDEVIIKDGDKVRKYDMQSNKIFKEINDLMIELVQGNVIHNEKYEVTYLENEAHYVLELTPQLQTMMQYLSRIFIYFDKTDYSVTAIKMIEPDGDYTRIIFKNRKLNLGLKDEVFIVD